jgi:UrcA family protein
MTRYSKSLRQGLGAALVLAAMLPLAQPVQARTISRTIPVSATPVGQDGIGAPLVRETVEKKVNYSDLDLRNPRDVKELNRRIAEAADRECQGMVSRDPIGRPGAYTCTKNAVANSRSQVPEAIAAEASR